MANRKLSIVIPTYNRADFIARSLEVHVPLAKKYGIEIFISDNCSSDNTAEVVLEWMAKYSLVHYSCNEFNLGADSNFEIALKLPETDYVWLLGDTYEIDAPLLEFTLTQLGAGFDHILVNVGGEVKNIEDKVYIECDEILADLFWLSTCLSCHIFSRRLIGMANFNGYQDSYFMHVGILFDYLAGRDFKVLWVSKFSVKRIAWVGERQKQTWMNKFFEIWIAARSNLIMSLPISYGVDARLSAIRAIEANNRRFDVRLAFALRANSILDVQSFLRFSESLKLVCSAHVYCALFLISLLPVSIPKLVRWGVRGYTFLFKKLIDK